MSYIGRKAAIGAVAFAMVGSTVFGGAALASDKDHGDKDVKQVTVTSTGGAGGAGGNANNNCLQIPVQIPILNLIGSSPANSATCTATANGGAGGTGAQY